MPEPSAKSSSPISFALLSNHNGYHLMLLQQFLASHFKAPCLRFTLDELPPADMRVTLVDCMSAEDASLRAALRQLSSNDRTSVALLNAEHNDEHEHLIDWPCLDGIFYIDTAEDQLLRGLEQLLDGDYWVPRRLLHQFFDKHRQTPGTHTVTPMAGIQLTNREREILRMIKDGMSNADVSQTLDLSEHTVKSHLYNIYKKIGVRNRLEASNWARQQTDLDAL